MKKVGFTGTRSGMTQAQKDTLRWLLLSMQDEDGLEFHHGDCIGADAQAHGIARQVDARIVIHPPINPTYRAFCTGDEIREEKEYYDRDRDIVDVTHVLIGASKLPYEMKQRSGTWKTIRYARREKHNYIVIWPNGSKE